MEMIVKGNWHRLRPETRQWLIDNPGCLILPRTLVATICEATGGSADCDQHGEITLSQEDRDFIRSRAGQITATGPEQRFFDATQP
ncbi:hypothetical protein SAMN04487916_1095 [Arthrobacter sp. ov407]|uniref:hypothetical protein n=1 Tax=Arthrobacter sp. ov407 TaxID=1761748 RepID=UPI00088FE3FA|nr:hypothetical protein [Arthrobacter sp. ov407]SDL43366.1 hypothetical protein SAMN04487916_1095 [Arthrobacter sp. ov407]